MKKEHSGAIRAFAIITFAVMLTAGVGVVLFHSLLNQSANSTYSPVNPNMVGYADKTFLECRQQKIVWALNQFMQSGKQTKALEWLLRLFDELHRLNISKECTLEHTSSDAALSLGEKDAELLGTLLTLAPAIPPVSPSDVINSTSLSDANATVLKPWQYAVGADTSDIRPAEVYWLDNATQLFAFRYSIADKRIYVVVNFSYDVHEMPLPFGFMASTKIELWRSGDKQLRKFVTQHPLSISPRSVAVIIT